MPYTLRRTWPDREGDYVVRCDGVEVGRMYRTHGVGGVMVWLWTIYGTPLTGREPTLEEAKAQWRAAFEQRGAAG
jgi:hypothetical protein